MKHSIESPPRTIMEVYKQLPEGTLAELIDGVLFMSPTPPPVHQIVSKAIFIKLFEVVELLNRGHVYYAPLDVYLDKTSNVVQPDLFVILNNSACTVSDRVRGVPDLIIEILSPSNQKHDLVRKKDLYERFGVNEYWIIDPASKLTTRYALKEKKFARVAEDIGVLNSVLLNCTVTF